MATRKRGFNRDLLLVSAPATLIVVGAFALTLLVMRPAPPSELVMSTGTADGSYHAYAMKYRDILARDGVTLRLWPSGGAVENLRRPSDPNGTRRRRAGSRWDRERRAGRQHTMIGFSGQRLQRSAVGVLPRGSGSRQTAASRRENDRHRRGE
jgi:hypothetical protein